MKFLSTCLTAVLLVFANTTPATHAASHRRLGGRKLLESAPDANTVPDQYIVVYDPSVQNVSDKTRQLFHDADAVAGAATVMHQYDSAIKGVSVRNLSQKRLEQIEQDPQVLYIEQHVAFGYAGGNILNQTDGVLSRGLDRLNQDALPLDGTFKCKQTGKGVIAFVLDSGIRLTHQEFGGRATCGFDGVLGQESDIPCEDKVGHGTHIAGIIGGKTVGVAKQVKLVAVKVGTQLELDLGAIVAGLNFVKKQKEANPNKPMIALISLVGPKLQAINDATIALIKAGVTVVVAAGNDGIDACKTSPGVVVDAITVGLSDRNDTVPDWSNFGSCIDIFAPGDGILSAWRNNDTHFIEGTGSSQSAALVAGVAALILELKPSLSPKQVWQAIRKDSLKNVLTGGLIDNSNNRVTIVSNLLVHIGAVIDGQCVYTGWRAYLCPLQRWVS